MTPEQAKSATPIVCGALSPAQKQNLPAEVFAYFSLDVVSSWNQEEAEIFDAQQLSYLRPDQINSLAPLFLDNLSAERAIIIS